MISDHTLFKFARIATIFSFVIWCFNIIKIFILYCKKKLVSNKVYHFIMCGIGRHSHSPGKIILDSEQNIKQCEYCGFIAIELIQKHSIMSEQENRTLQEQEEEYNASKNKQ